MGVKTLTIALASVVSAFPGCGKTAFFNDNRGDVADSDSSTFDKSQFPQNYIDHIQSLLGKKRWIMVSSHDVVREALVENKIPYVLVYPQRDLKDEYIKRYINRGSPQSFVDLLDKNWDSFIDGCEQQTGCEHRVLDPGQFLSDVLG